MTLVDTGGHPGVTGAMVGVTFPLVVRIDEIE